jgi:hypothetical protein
MNGGVSPAKTMPAAAGRSRHGLIVELELDVAAEAAQQQAVQPRHPDPPHYAGPCSSKMTYRHRPGKYGSPAGFGSPRCQQRRGVGTDAEVGVAQPLRS